MIEKETMLKRLEALAAEEDLAASAVKRLTSDLAFWNEQLRVNQLEQVVIRDCIARLDAAEDNHAEH